MEFCPNCGAKIEKNAEFCGECGYEFKKMKGIRPKQQISKKALAFLIVLVVFFLIINVQNIGALFIQPKTLNLNTVSSMTLFSNRLTIDPGTLNDQEIEAFVSLIFVVVFWAWLRKRYKSGMRVTKWFALL
ncbi:zinc-ribbon domain-containing protein [Ligilactobacillus aviarius]|uniref:zinc-ribbon domain-containing protein n=1 Tax=Ligilactobacillus aviarius TaxID=1606 RepID=UPI0024B89C5C|nr:zinc ribbon domain-containing protein [Ligilactobacillus aviarius]